MQFKLFCFFFLKAKSLNLGEVLGNTQWAAACFGAGRAAPGRCGLAAASLGMHVGAEGSVTKGENPSESLLPLLL